MIPLLTLLGVAAAIMGIGGADTPDARIAPPTRGVSLGPRPFTMGWARARVGPVAANVNPFGVAAVLASPWGSVESSTVWRSRAELPDAASSIYHDAHGEQRAYPAPSMPGLPFSGGHLVDVYGRPFHGEGFSVDALVPDALADAIALVAPIVGAIPGVGTMVGPALALAAAAGRGESVTDAVLAAARAAMPGGPLAQSAFDLAVGVARGADAKDATLAALRAQVPAGPARAAWDAGVAVARSRPPSSATRDELISQGIAAMT